MPLLVNGVQVDITALNNASPVIKQVAADIGGLETSAQDASKGVSSTSGAMDNMTLSASDLNVALGIVTAGVGAMVAAFKAGEIAAANERLIASGESLATSYNSSLGSILSSVKETSLGTVSEMDIIAASNKAMMLGVSGSADQLASLMEIAALRGRAMGISTTQAFDDMVRGIGRMSPMILDNLGIVVDSEGTYGKYAVSIGKTASELTRAEKIQALLNGVIEEGNKLLDDAGGLAEDNASHYERWNAELENTKNYLLENTLGMSRFADMGADALTVFRDLADNGFGYGEGKLNAFSLIIGLATERVADHNEQIRDADTARWAGMASMYETITTTKELAGAFFTVAGADEAAVEGAIKVQETYDKYNEKLVDLQLDHEELLAKKQQLIDQGWLPESEKIQAVNDKLADNEQAQKDVTLAMQGTLQQMLINTAAAGMDAEAQLALARATGQIDEAAYAALSAQQDLKKQYDDGKINAQEYADKTVALRDAIARLESKKVTITVDAILNEIRNSYQNAVGAYYSGLNNYGGGKASGGPVSAGKMYEVNEQGIPELLGYGGRQFLMMPSNGDGYVTPLSGGASPSGGMGGSSPIIFAPQIATYFGAENDTMTQLYPMFIKMLDQARTEGYLK